VEAKLAGAIDEIVKKDKLSIQVEAVWGNTLYHINDLTYNPRKELPSILTTYELF